MLKVRIYRKTPAPEGRTVIVELGRWWEIQLTRECSESYFAIGRWPSTKPPRGFNKRIKEGGIIPFWYGYAFYDFERDCSVYQPIPLNLLRAFWTWFKWKVLRRIKYEVPRWLSRDHDITMSSIRKDTHHQ